MALTAAHTRSGHASSCVAESDTRQGPEFALAAAVAHELNNALLAASTILDSAPAPKPGSARQVSSLIEESQSLTSLLLEALSPAFRPPAHPLDLADWLPSFVDRCARQLPPAIHCNCTHTHTRALVRIDPTTLALVLRTLISNAAQAIASSGTISVSVRPSPASHTLPVGLDIRVKDDGPGVSPSIAPNLFTSTRAQNTSDRRSGLGLNLARHLVVQCGGDLFHDLSHRPGAAMVIRLPSSDAST